MANRTFPGRLMTLDRNVVELFGRMTGAGAAALTGVNCLGWTIVRTGIGLFTITLEDMYPLADDGTPAFLGFSCSRQSAAASGTGEFQLITDNSATSAKTLLVRYAVAGAAADITAADVVFLGIIFRNTSTPRNGV